MKLRRLWYLVAREAHMPQEAERTCELVVRALARTVVRAASKGERVSLPGLGVFRARPRKGREFDLPQGGHHVIEPHTVLTFRVASSVRVLRRSP